MILRRFMQHVREQEWFAVWIDLLVVVIGIFLGLQVTDWNAARQDRLTEHKYIARLLETTDENISLLEQHKTLNVTLSSNQRKLLAYLSKEIISEEERTFLKQNLPLVVTWRNVGLNTGFLESLLNSGEWRIIKNPTLQELLPGVAAEADELNRQIDYFRDWATALLPELISRNKIYAKVELLPDFQMTSIGGAERAALAIWSDATNEELLTAENRGAVTALLAARLNFIGSIEKTLAKTVRLREVLQGELNSKVN